MNPRAETRLGPLIGTTDESVLCFRSVPYALPPVGARRFRPPEPPQPWPGTLDARRFGPAAPQLAAPDQQAVAHSEDCLTLSIWTPSLDGTPRPVLVFLHGGEFTRGGAAWPEHNPTRLARRGDTVVVAVQYRLGALGFLALSQPEGAPNLGLLDQIAALRLIASEIDAFGGDPRRVTLLGAGSGASCAMLLLGAGLGPELFQRAILQGPELELHSPESAAAARECFLEALAIGRLRREALEAAPLDAILRAQQRCEQRLSAPGKSAFRPVIDGELIGGSPIDALAGGAAREIALLAGSNAPEPALAAETAATRVLEAHSRAGGDGFAYLFTRGAQRGPAASDALRESELPFVLGTLEVGLPGSEPAVDSEDKRLARTMQDAWLAFARSGHPGLPTPESWPPYTAARPHRAVLGRRDQP